MNNKPVRITRIIRGSTVDGPGLRTVIFFKGCPLRCEWCHNPETQQLFPEIMYDARKCIHCNRCIASCQNGALSNQHSVEINRAACNGCFACCSVCPSEALMPVGTVTTIAELFKEISKDISYYRTSEGGVTLSGGEPLLFPEFVTALLKACQNAGIHTCIDTSAAIPASEWSAVVPWCNLFLVDVKHANAKAVAAQTVFENIAYLCSVSAKIWIRIPVIPDWNAEETDMKAIADALFPFKNHIEQIELLPFHSMADGKYRQLGRKWQYNKKQPVGDNQLLSIKKLFTERSLSIV